MAISRIGASSTEASSITIPGTYQNGDVIIIFAFNATNTTVPTTPSGWTALGSGSGLSAGGARLGWKLAQSGSETSGTWTNATDTVCMVYRGVATNKSPISAVASNALVTGGNANYPPVNGGFKCPGTSWIICFAGNKALDSTLETAPNTLVNQTDTVGASAEIVGHDSNGPISSWPSVNTTVSIGGTSDDGTATTVEIKAELGLPNNYQFVSAGNGMSVSEKIR